MRAWMAVWTVLAACGFTTPPPATPGDGPGDGDGTGSDALTCYGTFPRVCFSVIPTADRTITNNLDIDTNSTDDLICDQHNTSPEYCVYAGSRISLAARLTAHGVRPLVLLSTSSVDVAGDIDVSSNHDGTQFIGAGAATAAQCPIRTAATGSSGSYGGSFRGKGGDGNDGEPDDGSKGLAGDALTTFPTTLRGGCPGGDAVTAPGTLPGRGGSGGGAVAIVAVTTITLNGRINASGSGGKAGTILAKSGGGGGGSGGMIVLDAMTIVPQARALLMANGGGGAQGGSGVGVAGQDGSESSAPALPAAGGMNVTALGGFGGIGSSGPALGGASAGSSAQTGGGGGAGGGGAGFIRAPGVTGDTVISPASS